MKKSLLTVHTNGNSFVCKNFMLVLATSLLSQVPLSAQVTTFAGTLGTSGLTDGTGTAAKFNSPIGITVDPSGNFYVSDRDSYNIRKITSGAVVTTIAGTSAIGSTDATGTSASFNLPNAVAADASGNIYVSDGANHKIRKMTSAGVVTTLAGSGSSGSTDATGTSASFYNPAGVAVDASGNVYVADQSNNKIRKITPSGVVTTFAGSGTAGSTDATGTAASFFSPKGIAVELSSGTVYVAENNKIRKITSAGVVTTLAGSASSGSTDGTGTGANFNDPRGMAVDAIGNIYVADNGNNKIRKVTSAGVVTTVAGSGTQGSSDNSVATSATFYFPGAVAVDAIGNLFVADQLSRAIRKVTICSSIPAPTLGVTEPTSSTPTGTVNIVGPTGSSYDYTIDHINYQAGASFSGIAKGSTVTVTVRDATNHACFSPSSSVTVNSGTTAIESPEYNSISTGAVYPNPAKNEVYIRLSSEMKNQSNYKVIVYDASGKAVLTSYEAATEVLKLSLAQLEKGLYQIFISSGDKSMREKFVINE